MKTIFITGVDSGIGRCFVDTFATTQQYKIIATVKHKENLILWRNNPWVEVLHVDITNSNDLSFVSARLSANNQTVDVLINNAGISIWGPFLELDDDSVENVIQVNLLGTRKVIKTLLPFISKDGKIINIGSTSALVTVPFMGIYPLSKLAVKAMGDSLRREFSLSVDYKNIQITTVEPGSIATPMWERARTIHFSLESSSSKVINALGQKMIDTELELSPGPFVAAKLFHKLIVAKKLSRTYLVGRSTTLMFFLSLLPHYAMDCFFKILFRLEMKKLSTQNRGIEHASKI
jgi:short-subunit dehydrogenase